MPLKKLIWLELCGCSGNFISFLNCTTPSFDVLTSQYINLSYSNSHTIPYGNYAMDLFFKTINEGNYILVIEGAVSTRDNGVYNIIGYHNGKPITGLEAAKIAGENAEYIIAAGTCASFGGVSAAPPNLSNSVPVSDILGNKVIRMPTCPVSGDWMSSLILNLIDGKKIDYDSLNRPIYLYGITIHDNCPRRSYFDKKIFAKHIGEITCMFKLGCKGPVTKTPCPVTRWNGFINWPVGANTPCIGCANSDFPNKDFFTGRKNK